jgi:phosphoribosylanthranilate isomerase
MNQPKVKICGLSRAIDIEYANIAKPDYIGFVFAESRRKVTPETALQLRKRLAPGVVPVGDFVDADPDEIARICAAGIISVVQLHGGENEAYIEALRKKSAAPIIKAIRVTARSDIIEGNKSPADYILFDQGGGGTGQSFDWSLIREMRGEIEKPFFIAGGVDDRNLEFAAALNPYGIDVSSGAETDGLKDPEKIKNIVDAVRCFKGIMGNEGMNR